MCWLTANQAHKNGRKRDLYVPNPVLDHVFTAIFLALVVFVVYTISFEDTGTNDVAAPWVLFVALLFVVAGLVSLVKRISTTIAEGVNSFVVARGLVARPPIAGKVQMKKWQDQFWQFVVHVSMTVLEIHVLSTELSGLWGDMSNAWRPDPLVWVPEKWTRRLYLLQLVRDASGWCCVLPSQTRCPHAPGMPPQPGEGTGAVWCVQHML